MVCHCHAIIPRGETFTVKPEKKCSRPLRTHLKSTKDRFPHADTITFLRRVMEKIKASVSLFPQRAFSLRLLRAKQGPRRGHPRTPMMPSPCHLRYGRLVEPGEGELERSGGGVKAGRQGGMERQWALTTWP